MPIPSISSGQTGHIGHHNLIHAVVGGGLPTNISSMTDAEHKNYHTTIHQAMATFSLPTYPGGPALPSATVTVANGGNITSAVNGAAAGAAIRLSGTAYTITASTTLKANQKLFCDTKGGATITVSGLNADGEAGSGLVMDDGVRIENVKLVGTNSSMSGIQLGTQKTGGVVRSVEVSGFLRTGMGSVRSYNFTVEDCYVHHCGSVGQLGNNASGFKIIRAGNDFGNAITGDGALIQYNKFWDNTGNGLWFDVDCGNMTLSSLTSPSQSTTWNKATFSLRPNLSFANDVRNNTRRGIFHEVSRGPFVARWNHAQNNASDSSQSSSSGLGVSASMHAWYEFNNILNNVNRDIHLGSLTRDTPPWDPGYYYVRDCTITRNWMNGGTVTESTQAPAPAPSYTVTNNSPYSLPTSALSTGHISHHNSAHYWCNSRTDPLVF